eukprot:c29721_g1_i1 orf=740-1456(-)
MGTWKMLSLHHLSPPLQKLEAPFLFIMLRSSASALLSGIPSGMELGQDTLHSLSLCKDASSPQLEALAAASLSVVLGSSPEDTVLVGPAFEDMEVDFIKRTYSGLVCLYLEAAKNDVSSSELSSFLKTECGFSDAKRELLSLVFQERKEELRGLLNLTATHSYLPELLGVDWKLDYCVCSSEDRALRDFVYRVSLKTMDSVSGKDNSIEFFCSVEELQDLVSRLKDACKSVERAVDRR